MMLGREAIAMIVDDESWRRELCPDCGRRLAGLPAWKAHGPRHGWGSEWLSVRMRAALPGEAVSVDPALLVSGLVAHTVEDETWRAGLPV